MRFLFRNRLAGLTAYTIDTMQASIWNLHSVEGAFRSDHRMPPRTDAIARGTVSVPDGRTPPPTFLTTYGEHVAM